MDVTPLVKKGQQIIQRYKGSAFQVSGKIYGSAVIVTPDATQIWTPQALDVSGLTRADFQAIVDQMDTLDVVLLGCGAQMCFMPSKLKADLKAKGLSVDIMDTGAACRTYNVLMAEGRRVAAALLPYSA